MLNLVAAVRPTGRLDFGRPTEQITIGAYAEARDHITNSLCQMRQVPDSFPNPRDRRPFCFRLDESSGAVHTTEIGPVSSRRDPIFAVRQFILPRYFGKCLPETTVNR